MPRRNHKSTSLVNLEMITLTACGGHVCCGQYASHLASRRPCLIGSGAISAVFVKLVPGQPLSIAKL
jgi:hypothetical protein